MAGCSWLRFCEFGGSLLLRPFRVTNTPPDYNQPSGEGAAVPCLMADVPPATASWLTSPPVLLKVGVSPSTADNITVHLTAAAPAVPCLLPLPPPPFPPTSQPHPPPHPPTPKTGRHLWQPGGRLLPGSSSGLHDAPLKAERARHGRHRLQVCVCVCKWCLV